VVKARIYQPTRSAMQSGQASTRDWVLEYAPASAKQVDPLMGWTGGSDTQAQVRLRFPSREAALDYADENGIEAQVCIVQKRKPNIRPRGYGENFAADRKGAWTH